MHDIDRAMFEVAEQGYEAESYPGEVFETYEMHEAMYGAHELEEGNELELTTELLEITSEAELEQFLGSLLRKAVPAVRNFVRSGPGRAVGGLLKTAAKRALPNIGQTVGDWAAPGIGGQFGARAGQWAGGALGLEMEGLSAEDREFETARSFVRFATEAAKRAADAPPTASAPQAARVAAVAAAARHAPGLVPMLKAATPGAGAGGGMGDSGRWVRQGNRIVLLGI